MDETLNIFLLLFVLTSSGFMRYLVYLPLILWAMMQVSDWAVESLDKDPNLIGVSLLRPLFQYFVSKKLNLLIIKNFMEILVCFLSFFGWVYGFNAPIMPIFMSQHMRVKYATNFTTIHAFNAID